MTASQTQANRLPKKIMAELKKARHAATLEDASFAFPNDTVTFNINGKDPATQHPDKFIKETTRLYRHSWIIARIDRVIAWAEGREP